MLNLIHMKMPRVTPQKANIRRDFLIFHRQSIQFRALIGRITITPPLFITTIRLENSCIQIQNHSIQFHMGGTLPQLIL